MTKRNDPLSSLSRRQVLTGISSVALGGSLAKQGLAAEQPTATASHQQVADAPTGSADSAQRQTFYGPHQAGIVTARPAAGIVAAFDVVATTPENLAQLLRRLTQRIEFLMQGGPAPTLDPQLPPPDSGILGPIIEPDNLTVTVSLGASLFENRPWLESLKPRQLQRMAQFPNDALDGELCHGDLALQFCANTQDTNIHALRDILKTMSEFLVLRWKQEGSVPVIPPNPDGSTESARNFLGFRDGSANPDSSDEALMNQIVWVTDANNEPAWALGGSYQVVRTIRMFVERWDRAPLAEQEKIFGRKKVSGAPIDGKTEHDLPHYDKDPNGQITPLDSHIRLANSREPGSEQNLILRRPFNYSNGVSGLGQLDQGLLFIAYQADLVSGFISVQKQLDGEPLEEYIKPVGGGYFYVLPGVRDENDYLGHTLIEAITRQSPTQS